jgi:copper transport protein
VADSSYGRWLIIKLALVVIVVAVAAISRRIVRHPEPLVAPAHPASVGAAATMPLPNDEALRRSLVIEVVGMVIILAATAGLTGATPPRADADRAVDVTVSVVSDDQIAQLELLPAVTGGTTMHVTISTPAGNLDQADEITVTAELPAQQVGPVDIDTFPAGPNHVTTNNANFPIPGQWTITVAARYGEFDQTTFTIDVVITDP